MRVTDAVFQIIAKKLPVPAPVTEESNLYTDLRFDSLSFIIALKEIEDTYSIAFELTEMEACVQAGQLVTLVETKIKERENGND